MSRLDELLKQYCPNGVEWKPVGAVCDICTDYTAAGSFADIAKNVVYQKVPSDALLVRTMDIKSGFIKKNMVYINEHAYDYLWRVHLDKPCIIMPNIGNCGEVYHVFPEDIPYTKAALAPNAILLNSSIVVLRYLYHVLQSRSFQRKLHQIVTPVGQTKFNKTDFKALLIPVPPLPVQEEIVRILDKFTELEEELEEELELRKLQYEWYKNTVLDFSDRSIVLLSDLFNTRNGFTPLKSNVSFWENGELPWFRIEDIRVNGHILSDALQHITMEAAKNKPFSANSIIVSTTATIGEHALITEDFFL